MPATRTAAVGRGAMKKPRSQGTRPAIRITASFCFTLFLFGPLENHHIQRTIPAANGKCQNARAAARRVVFAQQPRKKNPAGEAAGGRAPPSGGGQQETNKSHPSDAGQPAKVTRPCNYFAGRPGFPGWPENRSGSIQGAKDNMATWQENCRSDNQEAT